MHPALFQIGSLLIPSYGVLAALGVFAALLAVQWSAPRAELDARHGWNALALGAFAGMAVSRLLLIALNLGDLRRHPRWLLALALVHHPLLTAAGTLGGLVAMVAYARWAHVPLLRLADALAAPVALGMALEQIGCLLAGSDYGRDASASLPWHVVYTSPLAARWSGTPLGVSLHPAQAYAALGALLTALICAGWLAWRNGRRAGELSGVWLMAMGANQFLSEGFRDWEGRGALHWPGHGAIVDAPQLVGLGMVIAGGLLLAEWRNGHSEAA